MIETQGNDASVDFEYFTLRPFKSSRTYRNLCDCPEGVFHIVDDVELLAHAVVGTVTPPMRPAEKVQGRVLENACRFFEFRIEEFNDQEERTSLRARVLKSHQQRDFFGFNRAKHAVVEAAILIASGCLPSTYSPSDRKVATSIW